MSKYVFILMKTFVQKAVAYIAGWRLSPSRRLPVAAFVSIFLLAGLTGQPARSNSAEPCIAGSPEYASMDSRRVASSVQTSLPRDAPALLTVPQSWRPGCSAAVLTWEGVEPPASRSRLVSGLIERGVAVLELDISPPFGLSADSGKLPAATPSPADILPLLFGALSELRNDGAGAVIVLGYGLGGASGLEAAALSPALAEGFTAAGDLGPGGSFSLGKAPPNAHWPTEATGICRSVAMATRLPTSCLAKWLPAAREEGRP